MEVGKQIRKYRQGLQLSQEDLAEKVYVSRQTVSNWETEKSYPDVHSLILLSAIFDISLDQLIKGDLEEMKQVIKQKDITEMNKATRYMLVSLLMAIILVFPAFYYFDWGGLLVFIPLWMIGLYFANRVEKIKKDNKIQTYRQIVAFSQGQTLDDEENLIEKAKYPYQKPLIVIAFTACFIVLAILIALLWTWIFSYQVPLLV